MGIHYILSFSGIVLHFINFGLGCGVLLAYLILLTIKKIGASKNREKTRSEIKNRRPPAQDMHSGMEPDGHFSRGLTDTYWYEEEPAECEDARSSGISEALHRQNLSAMENIGALIDLRRAEMSSEKEEYEKNLARVQRILQQHKDRRIAPVSGNITTEPAEPEQEKLQNMFDSIRTQIERTGGEAKRGRGRPRKEPPEQPDKADTVKRGRGRPRKYPEKDPYQYGSSDQPKRGRGRPRKSALPAAETSAVRESSADAIIQGNFRHGSGHMIF